MQNRNRINREWKTFTGDVMEGVEEKEKAATEVLVMDDDDDVARCILVGSAAAVRDAVLKRSDSDLSRSSDDYEGDQSGQRDVNYGRRGLTDRSLSSMYMEQASVEASPIADDNDDDNDHHRRLQLKPNGRMGRFNHRLSSLGIINVDVSVRGADDSDGSNSDDTNDNCVSNGGDKATVDDEDDKKGRIQEGNNIRRRSSFEIFHSASSMRILIPSKNDDGVSADGDIDSADQGLRPQSPDELSSFELSELLAKCGMEIITNNTHNQCTDQENTKISMEVKEEQDIRLLHTLFDNFCRPRLEISSVKKVVESERRKRKRNQNNNGDDEEDEDDNKDSLLEVVLPMGVVIQRPSEVLIKLLTNPFYLKKMPPVFASSIFRIFLRLLEGHTDFQYNYVILASSPQKEEAGFSSSEKIFVGTTDDTTTNANLVHSIVRLRMLWKNSIKSMLLVLESILGSIKRPQQKQQHYHKYKYLYSPITRLIGVLCGGGVTVDELRQMISLACDVEIPLKVKLSMVRALSVAASSTASRSSSLIVGRTNPMDFFSFISGPGIKRTINLEQTSWPFRNDFGTAFNFRAEDFLSESNCVLLQALNESGSGFEISTIPLPQKTKQCDSAAVLTIKVIEDHTITGYIKVSNCPLHARVWHHVALRLTRSRLKGVFSLSSREQLTVLIDGKIMLTEAMKFPKIRYDSLSNKALSLTLGKNFDGQVGYIYIFHDNISDATFNAIFEMNSETRCVGKSGSKRKEMKSNLKEIPSRNIQWDDLEHIAIGQCETSREDNVTHNVADLGEDEETIDGGSNPLSKSSFISRLYISWNPRRRENNFLMELHSGAHVLLDDHYVQAICIEGAQQVIGSIGGIQNLFTILWSILGERNIEIEGTQDNNTVVKYSLVPHLFNLLSCFVRGNNQNARELLRCGGIDIVEHLLFQNKAKSTSLGEHSMIRSLFTSPSLSKLTVQTLLELQSSCSHCIALERQVFSRLLFNIPLWFEGLTQEAGVSLYPYLLPALSIIIRKHADKVRDCVRVEDMIWFVRDLVETKSKEKEEEGIGLFIRNDSEINIPTSLTSQERHYLIDTLLGWIFQVFLTGPSMGSVTALMYLLSNYLEYEWNETAKEISENEMSKGNYNGRSLHREQRYLFTQKASIIFLFLVETSPPHMIQNIARACGSIEGGVAWLLSAFVNSYCDLIRSIGIKCVGAYVRTTAHGPDLPLSFSLEIISPPDRRNKMKDGSGNIQEHTMSLISNVGQGFLNVSDRKLNAADGTHTSPKLTPRVIYKLLWHLVKSHRYRIGAFTQAALVSLVFERGKSAQLSHDFLMKHLISIDKSIPCATKIEFNWAKSMMAESDLGNNVHIRDTLSMSTILRVLRFLPSEYSSRWLRSLIDLSRTNVGATSTITSCPDWQPCLFQFVSEITENLASTITSQNVEAEKTDSQQEKDLCLPFPVNNCSNKGLELSLQLYSVLLCHIIRNDGEKSIIALEESAALQRVYVNGSEVFALILSYLFANLFQFGVTSLDQKQQPKKMDVEEDEGEPSLLLKYTAKMVTDAILSNGARGMNLSTAVICWRTLKYLAVSTTAFVTSLGSSTAYRVDSKIDSITSGIFGILLPEDGIGSFQFEHMLKVNGQDNLQSEKGEADAKCSTFTTCMHKNFVQRVYVHIAAQMLSLLDVFVFPPEDSSLDLSETSHLHGLTLVRGTESQIGNAQGPLLLSLMRVSLLLLSRLEPCSVKMLQCCGRLRCFVHYSLELVRESEAMERYSVTFNKIALPFDRLLLSSFIRSHFVLQKCYKLLCEIESNPSNSSALFTNKERQKKSYRRLFRVTIELREILMTIHERRSTPIRNALTHEAMIAFQSCIESPIIPENVTGPKGRSHKEIVVRALLASDWVRKFAMGLSRQNSIISLVEEGALDLLTDEYSFNQELRKDSAEIENSFQKSLNGSFEEYLEKQRKWAETGAVRDLEFEGDTILKMISTRCKHEGRYLTKNIAALSAAADIRRKVTYRGVGDAWSSPLHWKLSQFNDQKGRRVVLVSNPKFDSHDSASYELMMGLDREREERHKKERMLQNELSDLMKRNSEAIMPYDESLTVEDDNEDDQKVILKIKEMSEQAPSQEAVELVHSEDLPEIQTAEESTAKGDVWARAFIWQDGESIVARFEKVMVVTLRYTFDGHLLLTTEGLYFHQVGDGINVISKEPCTSQQNDRRWRLNGLKEAHGRRYTLRTQALELFFADGQEVFLNFTSEKERNRFYAKLRNSCKTPMIFSPKSLNPRVVFKKSRVTELWKKRKISNFDYLMALNRMAGRTFNDIPQYPVFPWILADYESEKIDLSDSRIYRDLSKPVGALNPDRLAILLERYQELESFGFSPEEKFLYGSHYSSPGLILHFLIRQEPFTSMAIDLQSGKFDCPDRLFFDLKESWKSSNTSSSDVKELIPEFFTMPEILQNSNHFPFGKTQKGISVNDVGLPPWAKGSANEFIRIHRLALESEYVSCNLQNWIDLVFGYKQRGLEAEKAWNVFHYLSYEGSVDLDKINDDIDRAATESHIQNFGQTPSQLILKNPHPSRYASEISWKPLINNVATPVKLRCHTPAHQFGAKNGHGGGAVLRIHVKANAILVVYSDLKIGFFRWSPKNTTNHNKKKTMSLKAAEWKLQPDKLEPLPSRDMSYSRSVMKRGSAVPQTVGERTSQFAVGNWSFAMTIGGYEKEQLRRRNTVIHSRLASAKDALYTEAAPLLVSCGYWDNTIKVHSTDGWKLESSDSGGHRGPIRCLAIGADGGLLVTGGEDCTCRVWIVDFPEMAMTISDGYLQTELGRHPNEDQILVPCHVLFGHESAISCIALSSELDITVSGSINGNVCLHTLRTGEFVRSFSPSLDRDVHVTKIVLEEHGRIVIQMGDRRLYTYTINGTCLCSVDAEEQIHDLKITGEVVVTGGENGHVYIRNLNSLKILSGLNLSKHGPIRCISFTPTDLNPLPQFLFIGSDDGMISIVEHEE